ncbi:MAG: DNA repair protein RecO [Rickettsiales bacterium]|jgi:DNA repair protein RecO (recombination protein O)|nr:DNA repair protein RecO [Rickettsiales bacterium]
MPRVHDYGILLHSERHSDRLMGVMIFCENSGLIQTFLKKDRKMTQPQIYDILHISFDYGGSYSYRNLAVEILGDHWKNIFCSALLTNIFNYITAILNLTLKEKGRIGNLYRLYRNMLSLVDFNCSDIIYYHIDFLLNTLDFLGIRIDTTRCAVSGSTLDIYYISPRTGNCVSATVGEKYKHHLFTIPKSFCRYCENVADILSALDILHHFLFKIVAENNNIAEFSTVEMFREIIKDEICRDYQRRGECHDLSRPCHRP